MYTNSLFESVQRIQDVESLRKIRIRQQAKLCRACSKTGPIASKCNRRNKACKKQGCKELHTTLLHAPKEDKQEPTASDAPVQNEDSRTSTESRRQGVKNGLIGLPRQDRSLLPVVPVKIRVNGSLSTVVTQALLDTGITHSFMTEDLANELEIRNMATPKTKI